MATALDAPPQTATDAVVDTFDRYVVGNYGRYRACLVRGVGSEVWDVEGRRYLDLFPGWGCNLLGHCPPRVVRAVQEQVAELIHVPNTWYMTAQGEFAKALVERAFEGKVFFCNSGAEANEAAIKLVRAHQAPKYHIVTTLNSFHGRTLGAISATGQPKYQQGFGPLLPGFRHVPFGDMDALADACDDQTAAVMVEPIQGEGGVNLPDADYLRNLRAFTAERGILLVFDEVQTGMGRTGKWFAHQHAAVTPDVMTLAKALAGGVACGALVATPEVAASLKPGLHAATFGGNPLACRAGLATIETIETEGLLARADQIGERFRAFFTGLADQSTIIGQVRIQGAMIGIDLLQPAAPIVEAAMHRGLLTNATHGTVLRLLPALTLTDAQIDEGCAILREVILAAESD